MSALEEDKSVLEKCAFLNPYMMKTLQERSLSRLLFNREEINNKGAVISGGERIKLSIAKIVLSDYNMLVLDEPTNYLDIESRMGTGSSAYIISGELYCFVSHDRDFYPERCRQGSRIKK